MFEVEQWPSSELEYWSTVFNIEDTGAQPIVKRKEQTDEESYEQFMKAFGG